MNQFVPLKVTASIRGSFAASDPWSPALDGIIAYWALRERLGEEAFAASEVAGDKMTPVEGLPLLRVEWNDLWWWACSSPIYEPIAEFLRYFHRRFDSHLAETHMKGKKGLTSVKAGPYKNFRLTTANKVVDQIVWFAIGDPAEVARLLSRCKAIGARRGVGNGTVDCWDVEEVKDRSIAMTFRPLPVDYARQEGISSGTEMLWGIRPPARISQNVMPCVMPYALQDMA